MNVLSSLVDVLSDSTIHDSSPLHFLKAILSLQIEAQTKEREAVAMVKSFKHSVYIPPNASVTITGCISQDVSYKTAVVEPLRNSDHLPVGILVASSLVRVGNSFSVRIDNLSDTGYMLHPNTGIGVLRGVETVVDDSSELKFEVTCDEIKVTKVTPSNSSLPVPVDLSSFEGDDNQFLQVQKLLEKHQDVFATHDYDLGDTNTVQHKIETTESEPISQTFRRIPPNQYEEVKKHTQKLLDNNIIQESHSPYSSPIVLARKRMDLFGCA